MYLESLEIQGFKSFANKNKLIFPGLISKDKRGLTAIVGPNGSGKSNVADSIRWALGEQSLKMVRGKKSEDVIFSGSDKKGRLGLAEVSLRLNNAEAAGNKAAGKDEAGDDDGKEKDLDRLILSCPEITITRRVYRNGENEYLINNSRVRLADIQMLLAKANFGQKTYSVIGQGMVENFLNGTAAERKDFFDEATGVKQFQIKRESALNKLENSYENLQQVEMLLTEIRPRLKSLTRQVEKLRKRDEILKNLKDNQLDYYGYLWQDINEKLDKANGRFLDLEKTKFDQEKRLEKLNENLEKVRAADNFREMSALQPQLRELENRRQQEEKRYAKLQAELEIQLESQGQFDVSWLTGKLGELENDLETVKKEISALEDDSDQKSETGLRQKIAAINGAIADGEGEKRKLDSLEAEKSASLKQIAKLEAILEANLEVQGQFDVSWLNNKSEELAKEASGLKEEIAALRRENGREREDELLGKIRETQARIDSLNRELEAMNQELKRKSHNGSQNEAIAAAVDEFLARLEEISKETDLTTVKKEIAAAKDSFQKKISALIKGGTSEDLEKIQALQKEIISLNEDKQSAQESLNNERLRLSSARERLRLLEERDLQLARESADIRSKLEKAQTRFDASQIETEKTEIKNKIKGLEKEQEDIRNRSRLGELYGQRRQLNEELNDLRIKASARQERRRLLESRNAQTVREIADIKTKLEKAQTKFDASQIETEKAEIKDRLAGIEKEIDSLQERLKSLNDAQEQEKSQMFRCQQEIQALQQEINRTAEELNSLKIEAARQETKLEDLENNIRNDELEILEIKDHQVDKEQAAPERWQKEIASEKSQLDQIGGIDPETEKEFAETEERYNFLSGQTEDLNHAIKSLENVVGELDLNIKGRFDEEFKVISEKFDEYFKILFNGGSAKISKIMADENSQAANGEATGTGDGEPSGDEKLKRLRNLRKGSSLGLAGIDVQATPPGKKIQTVTMLSGGERALTAIALICAIISANPSPFVVLDEADAALDEANSERLAKILDDLSNKTQFIVITHNRACMRRASILYGVTMEADGVSKLLSVKLEDVKAAR